MTTQHNLTTTIEGVGTGWKGFRPDSRDYIFADRSKARMKTMRQLVDLQAQQVPKASLLGPRRDQHAEGSCTGHGVASALNRITRQDNDRWNTVYSPRFLYNMARIVEGGTFDAQGNILDPGPWIKVDAGAYVRDAVMAARKYGSCPESNWKYRATVNVGQPVLGDKDYQKVPTASRFKAAQRFRIEAQLCQSVEEVLSALVSGFPVAFGFTCFTNMWTSEVDRTGVIPMPSGGSDGGHCVTDQWFNLDLLGGVTFFENSWSARWGRESPCGIQGMGTMPLEFIRRGWASDMWAVVKEAA